MPRGAEKFEDRVAITGLGISRVGRRLMLDPIELTVEAAQRAIADAGLTPADIDGLSTYPGGSMTGSGPMSEGGIIAVEDTLRLRPSWINGGVELPGNWIAMQASAHFEVSGSCSRVP
jgi:acetyl-CoA acetyltransferase